MKANTLVKSFTVVLIFLAGVANAQDYKTLEDCKKAQGRSAEYTTIQNECNAMKVNYQQMVNGTSVDAQRPADAAAIRSCKSQALSELVTLMCGDLPSSRELDGNCDTKFDAYQSKLDRTNEECAKAGGGDLVSCTAKANACGLASSSVESGDGLSSLIGMVMGGGSSGGGAGACTLEDDTLEDRKAAIDDQIQRLEDEKVEAATKQADLDDELNQKKQEVNEKISDLETEFRKDEKEAKTQSMDEAADLQKKMLASNKKIRDNLAKVADKNTEIANLSFGIQQIMIESSLINTTCTDKVNAAKAAKLAPIVGADGKKRAPKYTMKESSKIKADLKLLETQCLQSEALKRDASLKGIADKKRLLLVEVDTYMKSNEDEQKSIELDRKALEEKEKLLTENQRKALEEKNTKLDNLSKSVADLAAIVERKKKALDVKIANRDKQIAVLATRKANLKPRFSGVASSISGSRASARAYLTACCKGRSSTVTKDHSGCGQVKSDAGVSTGFGSTEVKTGN